MLIFKVAKVQSFASKSYVKTLKMKCDFDFSV